MKHFGLLLVLIGVACAGPAEPAAGRRGPEPTRPDLEDPDPYVGLRPTADSLEVSARIPGFVGARALTRAGREVSVPVTWTSAAPEIATVDSTGRVLGGAVGTTVLVATFRTLRAEVRVRVVPFCRVMLAIQGPGELRVGESATWSWSLPACAQEAGQWVQWTTSDTAIVSIDSAGRATGRRVGTAVVVGTVQPRAAVASATTVRVEP